MEVWQSACGRAHGGTLDTYSSMYCCIADPLIGTCRQRRRAAAAVAARLRRSLIWQPRWRASRRTCVRRCS